MINISSLKYLLFFLIAFSPMLGVNAQGPPETQPGAANKPIDFRNTALRQLGLSRDQLQRIRTLNQERKPLMDSAQMRLRLSNRELDEIIYSDNASDADFQARLKDFQTAQAEVAKIRFMNELGVRRILTPQQLTRFRQLRQRFDQSRVVNRRDIPDNINQTQRPMQKLVKEKLKNRQF